MSRLEYRRIREKAIPLRDLTSKEVKELAPEGEPERVLWAELMEERPTPSREALRLAFQGAAELKRQGAPPELVNIALGFCRDIQARYMEAEARKAMEERKAAEAGAQAAEGSDVG